MLKVLSKQLDYVAAYIIMHKQKLEGIKIFIQYALEGPINYIDLHWRLEYCCFRGWNQMSKVMEVVRILTSYVEDFINAQGNNVEKRCNFFTHKKKDCDNDHYYKNKFFLLYFII